MGNSGARSSGPIGWPVPGCSGGWGGWGASARMLYQLRGISLSGRTIFVSATRCILSKRLRAAKDIAARGTNRFAPASAGPIPKERVHDPEPRRFSLVAACDLLHGDLFHDAVPGDRGHLPPARRLGGQEGGVA